MGKNTMTESQGILYSLICKDDGTTVLVKYQRKGGQNFQAAVLKAIQSCDKTRGTLVTRTEGDLTFHIHTEAKKGFVFVCVTGTNPVDHKKAKDCLKTTADVCSMLLDLPFNPPVEVQLKRDTEFYSNPNDPTVLALVDVCDAEVREWTADFRSKQIDLVDSILTRGEKVDTLVERPGKGVTERSRLVDKQNVKNEPKPGRRWFCCWCA